MFSCLIQLLITILLLNDQGGFKTCVWIIYTCSLQLLLVHWTVQFWLAHWSYERYTNIAPNHLPTDPSHAMFRQLKRLHFLAPVKLVNSLNFMTPIWELCTGKQAPIFDPYNGYHKRCEIPKLGHVKIVVDVQSL